MAGHSKWANRVHRKGRQDRKRSKLFNKLSRRIISAAREGGGNADMNHKLRAAIEQAQDADMPNDNIEYAIKRGTGEIEGVNYESALYEGYGPAGIALMIDVLTDNANRTVAELRNLMKEWGGSLGSPGCVQWMFERKGVIVVSRGAVDEDELFSVAVEAGAEDILDDDEEVWEVRTEPEDYQRVYDAFKTIGIQMERAEVTMVPTSNTPVPDDEAAKVVRLLDGLDEHDDVQHVFSNFEISDEVMLAMDT